MLSLWIIALWLIFARITRLPRKVTWRVLGGFWGLMILVQLVAPESGIAQTLGGSLAGWLVIGAAAGLVTLYRRALSGLKRRAVPVQAPAAASDAGLSEAELDRYSRHLLLPQIGGPGQMRLRQARVLVVGAGGLGAPVCLYLAAAGVGRITLADDDIVSRSNLQRQVIFRDDLRGEPKAYAAAQAMLSLNPLIDITPLTRRIGAEDAALIAGHDLVIDGTDSLASREALNRACIVAGVPMLSGAIARWDGQVTLFDPARGGPCMACHSGRPLAQEFPCAEAGVIGPLPGVIGSLLALEAVKYLTEAGESLRGRLLLFDGLSLETRLLNVERDPECSVCAKSGQAAAAAS
ncbi:MAG: molybdopterin-synthase adenylyltransferase MoeB [Paracoccus sp. (in: a-proteobacteria)]|nr:molybdopterin-synthase adenylyltransferase MoeB [Paracoccus sp. (in: a-proteobacteria)]